MKQHTENEISSHSSVSSWDNSAMCTCAEVITCALDRWEQWMKNMIFIAQYAAKERASSAALHRSAMESNCAGRKPHLCSLIRSLCSRRFCVSDVYPHHAGEAYVSLAISVARDTSHSESPFKPCALRTRRAYIDWAV